MPHDNTPPEKEENKLDQLEKKHEVVQGKLDAEFDKAKPPAKEPLAEDNRRKIQNSNTGIILHTHELLKISMNCVLGGFIFFVFVCLTLFIWMLCSYVSDIIGSPKELETQLATIWNVLSGAFVILFFQLMINLGKNIAILKDQKQKDP